MSFTSDVRNELCEEIPKARHCLEAEALAMLQVAGRRYALEDGRTAMGIRTESIGVASKFFTILSKGLRINEVYFQTINGTGRDYNQVAIASEADVNRLGQVAAGKRYIDKACCRRAYLRGVFLVAGVVTDPERCYRLEIVCPDTYAAESVSEVMRSFSLNAKIAQRKGLQVVYLQDSDNISDMLGLMGAGGMMMSFENARIMRERKGTINRRVNCEVANLGRAVTAARKKIEDIEFLQNEGYFLELPGELKQIAEARLQYPEMSLADLGGMSDPPISKSAVNHRMRKLSEIAEKIRSERKREIPEAEASNDGGITQV
ncbi:MAG: DNA-binding protein WhiA [Lachnospiraceae bacterium]|nr:DNA-binding protein WhiA [Candidatus Equihabitans merdae]